MEYKKKKINMKNVLWSVNGRRDHSLCLLRVMFHLGALVPLVKSSNKYGYLLCVTFFSIASQSPTELLPRGYFWVFRSYQTPTKSGNLSRKKRCVGFRPYGSLISLAKNGGHLELCVNGMLNWLPSVGLHRKRDGVEKRKRT
jgi:hypothetical protein